MTNHRKTRISGPNFNTGSHETNKTLKKIRTTISWMIVKKRLDPLEAKSSSTSSSSKKCFSKKDLTEAVRRVTGGRSSALPPFDAVCETGGKPAVAGSSSSLRLMEWGVNMNARKFNELRTSADRKAAALKTKLDTLRSLKLEQEALQGMCGESCTEAVRIRDLVGRIDGVSDVINRRLHYRRQLEQMLRRLQKNQVVMTQRVATLDDALGSAEREYCDMKSMLRQIDSGHTRSVLELAAAQRQAALENDDRARALEQRKTESAQASRLERWRRKRELARLDFAAELRGDLSQEEEAKLQATLAARKTTLVDVRAQHDGSQKTATSLEAAFMAVRQATGVNSLDEVVAKFQSQEGNRRALATEKKDAEERLANAKRAKEDLETRFADLKARGLGATETSREIADQLEREIASSRVDLKASNAACERLESLLVALRQGAVGLYQRLRPFAHLLEGEGALPTAAMLPGGGGGGGSGGSPTSASAIGAPTGETPAIDSLDAIHLSEIMLSKMVETIGGTEQPSTSATTTSPPRRAAVVLDDDDDADDRLPSPENNIRVPSTAQRRHREAATFITDDTDEPTDGPATADDDDDGLATLVNADKTEDLEDMVPTRTFLKLSSSRQHSEMLRRQEQDARKKRMLERMELADESDRAAMSSRAARKRAQDAANARLATHPSTLPPPQKIYESAVDRSVAFVARTPHLE